jgi:hypothetical protein
VTEISDGRLDGDPPRDELEIVAAGDDFGLRDASATASP